MHLCHSRGHASLRWIDLIIQHSRWQLEGHARRIGFHVRLVVGHRLCCRFSAFAVEFVLVLRMQMHHVIRPRLVLIVDHPCLDAFVRAYPRLQFALLVAPLAVHHVLVESSDSLLAWLQVRIVLHGGLILQRWLLMYWQRSLRYDNVFHLIQGQLMVGPLDCLVEVRGQHRPTKRCAIACLGDHFWKVDVQGLVCVGVWGDCPLVGHVGSRHHLKMLLASAITTVRADPA